MYIAIHHSRSQDGIIKISQATISYVYFKSIQIKLFKKNVMWQPCRSQNVMWVKKKNKHLKIAKIGTEKLNKIADPGRTIKRLSVKESGCFVNTLCTLRQNKKKDMITI